MFHLESPQKTTCIEADSAAGIASSYNAGKCLKLLAGSQSDSVKWDPQCGVGGLYLVNCQWQRGRTKTELCKRPLMGGVKTANL